jgi:hypothetical protein
MPEVSIQMIIGPSNSRPREFVHSGAWRESGPSIHGLVVGRPVVA